MLGRRILFVLGGLAMGGVETYIVRLAKELTLIGCSVELLILSNKFDPRLMSEISRYTTVTVLENAKFLTASSWVNAFLPVHGKIAKTEYDIVHVVDLLTLGFIFLNKDIIKFKALSIGIYHALEVSWWRDRNTYFRRKLIELYDRNITLTLFPSESVAKWAGDLVGVASEKLDILPLGVDLSKYDKCTPSRSSRKIVSVGRLVGFKIYNRHMISQLSLIRRLDDFEYYIYGEGPEKESLQNLARECGISDYVHFMGQVEYEDLSRVLSDVFCFIGSGTTIIEASAAGIPSIVGIESIKTPCTCGFFSDVAGYSYNEESATSKRITFYEALVWLNGLTEVAYNESSLNHRKKAMEFDLRNTASEFLSMSCKRPDFNFSFDRWRALISFSLSIIRFGPRALKSRFDKTSRSY